MTKEYLTIFLTASFRKYLDQAGVGVPINWLQQGNDGQEEVQDEVQVLTSIQFPERGFKNEDYAILNAQILVKTKVVPTDIYYHTRVKARVVGLMDKVIPVLAIGGDDTRIYTKEKIGILRRIPSETITVTPNGLDVPDSSIVEVFLEYQPC